jgi:hypothetical protein
MDGIRTSSRFGDIARFFQAAFFAAVFGIMARTIGSAPMG